MATSTLSKQDLVYTTMRNRLTDGTYPPGQRINVAEISRELGISNIPTREALRRLEAEGWLEHSPNAGMRVAERDAQAWVDLMTPFAVLSGFATAEAAEPLRTDGGVADLRALNARMRTAFEEGDYAAATATNAAFHQRIFDSVRNPELRRSLTETWERLNILRRALFGAIPSRAFRAMAEHDALVDLIERDADRFEIESAAREHMLLTVAANRTGEH
ncbi:MAG TPA: GntR family transcriptional regulator [Baekduia sp.]|nr:GntR family transcriptional regulator [Baekduia sp.]